VVLLGSTAEIEPDYSGEAAARLIGGFVINPYWRKDEKYELSQWAKKELEQYQWVAIIGLRRRKGHVYKLPTPISPIIF